MGTEPLTFAMFLTPAGALVAGALISGTVEVIKKAVPAIDEAVSGAIIALFCSTILYILTAITQLPLTPDQALQVFAAWLGVTATAIGVKATTEHISGSET